MGVLVGIPTHRRPELLRQCLDSIAAQTGELPPVRVFVADNDPKGRDGMRLVEELAADYRFPLTATLVEEPGISAVRNAILAEARRGGDDFIAMIDDDETASEQWLAELLKVQADYGADVVGGPAVPVFAIQPTDVAREYWVAAERPEGLTDPLFSSANCFFSTSLMRKLDWPTFDPAFGLTGGGDAEWFSRIGLQGAVFAWSPKAVAHEFVPADRVTDNWVIRRTYRYSINRARILILHRQWRPLARFLTRALVDLEALPLLMLRSDRARKKVRLARATGRLAGALGITYLEYALRHSAPVASKKP